MPCKNGSNHKKMPHKGHFDKWIIFLEDVYNGGKEFIRQGVCF